MLDLSGWTEKRFARWNWRELLISLLVVALAMFAAGLLLPASATDTVATPVVKGQTEILPLLLDRRDTRGYRTPPMRRPTVDTFNLLLITDSAMLVKGAPAAHRYGDTPQYSAIHGLAEYIKSVDNKKLIIHEYFNTGMRSSDLRRIVLHGIQDPNIDAAIININPLMIFNDWMPVGVGNQRLTILREHGLTGHDVASTFVSMRPSDFLFEAAASIWPFYSARFPLSLEVFSPINQALYSGKPFPRFEATTSRNPWMVGYRMIWLFPEEVLGTARRAAIEFNGYTQMAMLSDLSEHGFGVKNFRANLRTLKAWGKPVLLYVPPLAPKLVTDVTYPQLSHVIDHIEVLASQLAAPNIRVVTETATAAGPDWLYFDGYHPRQGNVIIKFMADLIERELKLPIERGDMAAIFPKAKVAKQVP